MSTNTYLLWIDLETTGLNPYKDQILEVAGFITPSDGVKPWAHFALDDNGKPPVDTWFHFFCEAPAKDELMNDFVKGLHTDSGLLEDLENADRIDVANDGLSRRLCAILDSCVPEDAKVMLAGNSVHFDAAFLKAWCPALMEHPKMSHRILDVTSILTTAEAVEPGISEYLRSYQNMNHRAMNDIVGSYNIWLSCLDCWYRGLESLNDNAGPSFFGVDYHDGYQGESFMTLIPEGGAHGDFMKPLYEFVAKWVEEGTLTDDNSTNSLEGLTLKEAFVLDTYSRNSYSERVRFASDTLIFNLREAVAEDAIKTFIRLVCNRPNSSSFKELNK